LRPFRASRALEKKTPNPRSSIRPPMRSWIVIVVKKQFTTRRAMCRGRPGLFSTSRVISWDRTIWHHSVFRRHYIVKKHQNNL